MATLNNVIDNLQTIITQMNIGIGLLSGGNNTNGVGNLFGGETNDNKSSDKKNINALLLNAFKEYIGGKDGKSAGKGAVAAMIAKKVEESVQDTLNLISKGFSAFFEIQKTNIRAEKNIMTKRVELFGDTLKKASENAVSILTGDLAEAMYSSFRNTLDFGLSQMNKSIEMRQIEYERAMNIQITNMNALNGVIGDGLGVAAKNFSSSGAPWAAIVGSVLGIAQQIMRASTEIEAARIQGKLVMVQEMNDLRKNLNERMFGLAETQIKLGENVDKILMNLDKGSYEMARGLGIGAQATIDYKNAIVDANIAMSQLGKSWEDMLKIQQAYIDTADRNMLLTGKNTAQTSAIGMLFGIGDAESGAIMGVMNVFNKSIESGSSIMFQMYKTATRMGVSNQKFAKDLQNTLKLSQRYQFKDGVKGVMEMALWAQKVRMNIGDMESALSRMHTGNIEDVLQTSARLNVLGGNAALLSDPMALLFNAYADPKKYMENINRSIRGMGTVNRTSGETSFSIAEQMKIEQIANAYGVSAESLFNQARQANKAEAIKRRYGNRFGEATDYVVNNATWDEKKGTFVVNVLGDDGKAHERRLDELRKEEIEKIFPEDNQEQLLSYVGRMLSIMEEQHKTENYMRAVLMGETATEHGATHRAVHKGTVENFENNLDWFKQNILDTYSGLQSSMENQFALNNKMAEEYRKNGNTLLSVVTDISNQQFGQNIERFSDMIKAFAEKDWDTYIGKYDTKLKEWMYESTGVLENELTNQFGGPSFYKSANYNLTNLLGGGTKMFMDWITGSLGTGYDISKVGRMVGARAKSGSLDQYKMTHGMTDKSNREAGQKAIAQGYIQTKDYGNNTIGFVWRDTNTPVVDDKNRPIVIHRSDFWGAIPMKTKPINTQDAIITPRGMVYTHPDDTIMAFKPNGPIMNGMNNANGGNTRLEVSGTLRLDTGNQSVDLLKLIKDNPYEFGNLVASVLEKTKYGGRSKHAASWNMLNNL